MKVAISSEGTDLESSVGRRFGISPYFIIADPDAGDFEAVRNPGSSGERGAGMQTVAFVLSKDVDTVLTGYCSPAARDHLEAGGMTVVTGLEGTAGEVLERYKKGEIGKTEAAGIETGSRTRTGRRAALWDALRQSCTQFASMLPVLAGVMLLVGLFHAFVSKKLLVSLFPGNVMLDTFWGACAGSIFAGNPVNSYVIGGELLRRGVSLFAVTALIVTWVTVGLVQLPAEMSALGARFAILRNTVCFLLSLPIAVITVVILDLFR